MVLILIFLQGAALWCSEMYFLYCHCVNDRPLSKSIFQFTSCETQRFSESGSAIPPDTRMAENILVDGKPLHLLRVVDLREELKKRNIKTTGTKVQLQELLIKVCFPFVIQAAMSFFR